MANLRDFASLSRPNQLFADQVCRIPYEQANGMFRCYLCNMTLQHAGNHLETEKHTRLETQWKSKQAKAAARLVQNLLELERLQAAQAGMRAFVAG